MWRRIVLRRASKELETTGVCCAETPLSTEEAVAGPLQKVATMGQQALDGIFDDAVRRLDRAAEFAEMDAEALERLRHPKAVSTVSDVYAQRSVCDCTVCGCAECHCDAKDTATGEVITNQQLLELKVDVLIPAALENQITSNNAARVMAPVIVEVANGPTTNDADEILRTNGMLVVPDILANAGGVTVSYFEWVQNRAGCYWTEDEVHDRLQSIMAREFNTVYKMMTEKKIDMRTAAYAHALIRLSDAIEAQGTSRFFSNQVVPGPAQENPASCPTSPTHGVPDCFL